MKYAASASSWIKAPQPTVYSVLSEYRWYETWLPDVTRSRLLAREGGVAIVELIAPAWGSEKILLEMVESPESIVFTQIDRYREKGLTGSWRITPTEQGEGVIVQARLATRFRPFSLRCRRRLGTVLDRALAALGDRALRFLANGGPDVSAEKRLVLEIAQNADHLVVSLGDDVYDLVKRERRIEP